MDRAAATGYNLKRLQKALDELTQWKRSSDVTYYLAYPWNLKIKRDRERFIAEKIINAIINNQKEFSIDNIGNFKVIIRKPDNEGFKIILAASISPVRSIDPAGTIHNHLRLGKKDLLKDAELKFREFRKVNKVDRNILLLVNRYFFGDKVSDFIEALTYSYKDLLSFKNIDEIWLQIGNASEQPVLFCIYKKDFLESFDRGDLKAITSEEIKLFEDWFYPLSKLGDNFKEKLFTSLKIFLENKKPYQVFDNTFALVEMVRLGLWLAEKERFSDVIWIIDKFIEDFDPEDPEKYSGDPKFNYHQKIADGEDPHIIITVLGHLAWVVQKLAVRKNYIVRALSYTKKLLSHKNLYVKLQAIIPLIEIVRRRQWLEGWGKRPRKKQYKEFHKTVFDLVVLVQKNPNYKAIAKWLCYVFAYYKDLSTKEAEQVLDALKITEESASFFIYFGVFRQKHYKNQSIKFNGKKLEKKLKELLQCNKEEYHRLRASIVWHLWKILDENRNEFETIKPYIDLTLEQPYQKDIYDDIERIIKDWIKNQFDICIQWYKQMLSKISEFLEKKKRVRPQEGLWLMYTEEIIETIARHNSNELLEAMEKLVSFWKKGAFIGSPKRLFRSFRLIPNEKQRTKVKKEFQKWYNSMRRLNPKIEKIDWD